MENDLDAVIIGAGIAGLTAAFSLQESGLRVRVLEKQDRPGGVIHTVEVDGFLVEEGPNSLLDTHTEVTGLLERLGLAEKRIFAGDASSTRYVVREGRPVALPLSPGQFFRTSLFSTGAKLRLLREPFIAAWDGEEESVAHFVRRRLGKEFLDYAINPFVAGVYAGNPERLSVEHAFPKLFALEQRYGSLIRGQLLGARERKKRGGAPKTRARMYSFENGLSTLPAALASRLGDRIQFGAEVNRAAPRDGSVWEVTWTDGAGAAHEVSAGTVLYSGRPGDFNNVAVQSQVEAVARNIPEVAYPPVTVLGLGFQRRAVGHPLDGFGMLVPEIESRNILGALFSSTLFPGRAPDDHVLLTVFVGGTRQPELALLESELLLPRVMDDLRDLLDVRENPVKVHRRTWANAIPQYDIGYGEVKTALRGIEESFPGLFFAGNYCGGISVPDTMAGSLEVAKRITHFLRQS